MFQLAYSLASFCAAALLAQQVEIVASQLDIILLTTKVLQTHHMFQTTKPLTRNHLFAPKIC